MYGHAAVSLHDASSCTIFENTELATLIQQADLVIWDEAPMQHCHIMEAVDHSFWDLHCSPDKPFSGLTIVFGKDFQNILLVIFKCSRAQAVGAGHGQHTDDSFNITLPDHFHCAENTVDSLINIIYPDIHIPGHSDQYLSEHIILSSMNKRVNELNETILTRSPDQARLFPSVD
jgi:PIF1-like helicase